MTEDRSRRAWVIALWAALGVAHSASYAATFVFMASLPPRNVWLTLVDTVLEFDLVYGFGACLLLYLIKSGNRLLSAAYLCQAVFVVCRVGWRCCWGYLTISRGPVLYTTQVLHMLKRYAIAMPAGLNRAAVLLEWGSWGFAAAFFCLAVAGMLSLSGHKKLFRWCIPFLPAGTLIWAARWLVLSADFASLYAHIASPSVHWWRLSFVVSLVLTILPLALLTCFTAGALRAKKRETLRVTDRQN